MLFQNSSQNPETPTITNGRCGLWDLTKSIDESLQVEKAVVSSEEDAATKPHIRRVQVSPVSHAFDVVMSLEVAEHVPPEHEHAFVENVISKFREKYLLQRRTEENAKSVEKVVEEAIEKEKEALEKESAEEQGVEKVLDKKDVEHKKDVDKSGGGWMSSWFGGGSADEAGDEGGREDTTTEKEQPKEVQPRGSENPANDTEPLAPLHFASKALVLSWGNQRGLGHYNNRPSEYVIEKFEKELGFYYDENASIALRAASELPWFRNTIHVVLAPKWAQ
jgi:hypothetical protein